MIRNIYFKQGYECFEQNFKNRQDFISYLKHAKTSSTFIAKTCHLMKFLGATLNGLGQNHLMKL